MKNRKEIIKVAHYYYDLDYTQQEIADKLNMSRQRVKRLLKKALDEGIVEIQVHGYKDSDVELESELESRLGLKEAKVYADAHSSAYGAEVIRYVEECVPEGGKVGVTYGATLAQVCNVSMPPVQLGVDVLQLNGGVNFNDFSLKPDQITNKIAYYLGGRAYSLFMPALVRDPALREMLTNEPQTAQMLEMFNSVDAALISIGMVDQSCVTRGGYLSQEELDGLQKKGAVGDVCVRFYDIHGNIVDKEFEQYTTGITTEQLKKIPVRIGVAYGEKKVVPILGALRAGFINVLFTDVATARLLMEEAEKEEA